MKPNLIVEIAGIRMKNPIMPASGTFGYGEEFTQFFDLSKLGAIVTKGTSLKPKLGNPQPRIAETEGGMINCIGLQNPGIKAVIKEKVRFLRQFDVAVILNIAGQTIEEFKEITQRINGVIGIDGLEVNISCPNIKEGGMAFGVDPKATYKVVAAVRRLTNLPLIIKLTPNVTDIKIIARSAIEAGADALSLINTVKARAYIKSGPQKDQWIIGGSSGPCIKPIALQKVAEVMEINPRVPLIGIGGIMNFEDALDFFRLGVKAVQVGTANFPNPLVLPKIIADMEKYFKENQISDMAGLYRKLKE